MFPGLTLPPYKTRTSSEITDPCCSASRSRTNLTVFWAIPGVAVLPVPIAYTDYGDKATFSSGSHFLGDCVIRLPEQSPAFRVADYHVAHSELRQHPHAYLSCESPVSPPMHILSGNRDRTICQHPTHIRQSRERRRYNHFSLYLSRHLLRQIPGKRDRLTDRLVHLPVTRHHRPSPRHAISSQKCDLQVDLCVFQGVQPGK